MKTLETILKRKLVIAYYKFDVAKFKADYITLDYSEANRLANRIEKLNLQAIKNNNR